MRRPPKRPYHRMADINIANLVDVVLVLLIIFMISAPLLQSGIEVNLPKTTAAPVEQDTEGVVISIDQKGGIFINDVWARENFEDMLKREMDAKGTRAVFIRGDSLVAYGRAIDVIGRVKAAGVEEIGLITGEPDRTATRRSQR